jgi:hypothetical protein
MECSMVRKIMRAIVIIAVAAMLVPAQGVCRESVFTAASESSLRLGVEAPSYGQVRLGVQQLWDGPIQHDARLPALAGLRARGGQAVGMRYRGASADTVETFGVEIEEEKGPGLVRELAIVIVVGAAVAYAAYELLKSDENPPASQTPGKEPPSSSSRAAVVIRFAR